MQIKGGGGDTPHLLRTGVGTRSLAAAAAGAAGGGGPYASLNRHSHHPRNTGGGSGNDSSGAGYGNAPFYTNNARGGGGGGFGGGGGGGGGAGGEGAAVSAAACAASSVVGARNSWGQPLDQLRTDDVIPTPLEISSPGGAGDILSLSCLGSYLAVSVLVDVFCPYVLYGSFFWYLRACTKYVIRSC